MIKVRIKYFTQKCISSSYMVRDYIILEKILNLNKKKLSTEKVPLAIISIDVLFNQFKATKGLSFKINKN